MNVVCNDQGNNPVQQVNNVLGARRVRPLTNAELCERNTFQILDRIAVVLHLSIL